MKSLIKNKKGQAVTGIIGGIVGLVILVIILLMIIDTLNGTNLISRAVAKTITNETLTSVDNVTGESFSVATLDGVSCSAITFINATGGETISSGNYTVTGCSVVAKGDTEYNGKNWKVTYTYTWVGNPQNSINVMISNYTKGIDNVSAKVPTILLIAAVIILFGAIVLLVARSRQTQFASSGGI